MRKRILALMFGFVLAFSTSVSASIVLDNWTLDLTNVDGGVTNLAGDPIIVTGVSEITYLGMAHGQTLTYNSSGLDSPYSVVDGLLSATDLVGEQPSGGTGNIPFTSLGDTWEMTFDFSTNVLATGIDPVTNTTTFTHLAYDTAAPADIKASQWADGFLDIYVESFANPLTDPRADFTDGSGYRDGEWIARFVVDFGEGGVFTPNTFDGSDDASFSLLSAKEGVFLHPIYGDLSDYTLGELEILFAITDSNLDGDPLSDPADNFGIGIDYYTDLVTDWPFLFKDGGSATSNFLKEDGSVVIGVAVIPEPSTFLLLGAGLLGLGFIGRKKIRK